MPHWKFVIPLGTTHTFSDKQSGPNKFTSVRSDPLSAPRTKRPELLLGRTIWGEGMWSGETTALGMIPNFSSLDAIALRATEPTSWWT